VLAEEMSELGLETSGLDGLADDPFGVVGSEEGHPPKYTSLGAPAFSPTSPRNLEKFLPVGTPVTWIRAPTAGGTLRQGRVEADRSSQPGCSAEV
jgi:hypothetical protein